MWWPTSPKPQIWCCRRVKGDNQGMEIDQTKVEELEQALEKLQQLDPAELPEPATELADLLGQILEDLEQ